MAWMKIVEDRMRARDTQDLLRDMVPDRIRHEAEVTIMLSSFAEVKVP